MCGIIGYTGYSDARGVLIKGLKTLEYRGYDSAGIALYNKNKNEADDTWVLLISAVEYAAELPFVLPQDSDRYYHVQAVAGKRKVARYVDSETGIQSRNHFVILNSVE